MSTCTRRSIWDRGERDSLLASIMFLGLFVFFAWPTFVRAQDSKSAKDRTGAITGRITIQGKPAQGLSITLFSGDYYSKDNAVATTETDEDGRYRITGLPSNNYLIKVFTSKYVGPGFFNGGGPERGIRLADGASIEADMDLIPGGAISGRITDTDGNPVAGEPVQLISIIGAEPPLEYANLNYYTLRLYGDEFKTDNDGNYRLYGIPPGRYLIKVGYDIPRLTGEARDRYIFRPTGRVTGSRYFEQTFYPGITDRTRAQSIEVSAGGEVTDLNMTVGRALRAYTASGRLVDAQSGKPITNSYISVAHRLPGGGYTTSSVELGASDTDENGNFHVTGLIPGRFTIAFRFEGAVDLFTNVTDIEVKNEDIAGLEVKAYRGVTIDGRVSIEVNNKKEAAAKLSQLELQVRSIPEREGEIAIQRKATVNSDGSFRVIGLRPGGAAISIGMSTAWQYFNIVRADFPKAPEKNDTITLPEKYAVEEVKIVLPDKEVKGLHIALRYKNAIIRGNIKTIGTMPETGGVPLQISVTRTTERRSSSSAPQIDANGNFRLDGLEPGKYDLLVRAGDVTEARTIILKKDEEAQVSFVIDFTKSKEKD